jgi:FtsZ-binding cell division protein ZapB
MIQIILLFFTLGLGIIDAIKDRKTGETLSKWQIATLVLVFLSFGFSIYDNNRQSSEKKEQYRHIIDTARLILNGTSRSLQLSNSIASKSDSTLYNIKQLQNGDGLISDRIDSETHLQMITNKDARKLSVNLDSEEVRKLRGDSVSLHHTVNLLKQSLDELEYQKANLKADSDVWVASLRELVGRVVQLDYNEIDNPIVARNRALDSAWSLLRIDLEESEWELTGYGRPSILALNGDIEFKFKRILLIFAILQSSQKSRNG